jgi:hypothetical protein
LASWLPRISSVKRCQIHAAANREDLTESE